jgi:predicted GIY-YIG superfamily endonuclease
MAWASIVQNLAGQHCAGVTTDLEQRIQSHNDGVSKWTKNRGSRTLIWSKEWPTIGEARKLESSHILNPEQGPLH